MPSNTTRPAVVLVALLVTVLVAAVGASVVSGASGGGFTQAPQIDTFEDNDTSIDHGGATGWSDPDGVLDTTDDALAGDHSLLYQPRSTVTAPPTATLGSATTANISWLAAVTNKSRFFDYDSKQSIYSGGQKLLSVRFDEPTSGSGEINVTDATGNTTIATYSGDGAEQSFLIDFDFGSDQADVYHNGTFQFTADLINSVSGWDKFELNEGEGEEVDVRIDNVGATVQTAAPIVEDEQSTPTGKLQNKQVNLKVPIKDADFPSGDSVEVDWYKDGSKIDSTTITSNQTVSKTVNFGVGGSHTYHVEVVDDYGNSVVGNTTTVQVPSELRIRNESDPDSLVKNTEVRIEFVGNNTVVNRTTTNGKVDLTGLFTGGTLIADVEADGFRDRRVLIRSLYEQQSVYLLNDSISAARIAFQLDDATGDFSGPGTRLLVKRPLNQSGTTEFRTIVGDEVGADGTLPADLETNQRYRLVVESPDGQTRTLGSYIADGPADPEIIPIGAIEFTTQTEAGTAFGAALRDRSGGRDVRALYVDEQDATQELNITVRNADSGNVILDTTITDPTQRHVETVPVPAAAPDNVTYEVLINASRLNQPDVNKKLLVGDTPDPASNWPIDGEILTYAGWLLTFALAGWFGLRSPRAAPLATVLVAGLFTVLGVYQIPAVLLGLGGVTATTWMVAGDSQ